MNRLKEFSTQTGLSRSLMNSLMAPAVIGAILWKFYEVIHMSTKYETQFIYAVINAIVLLSVMVYLVVQFVIDSGASKRSPHYTLTSFALDILVLSLLSFLVLSLPSSGSYVTSAYLTSGVFAVLLTWNIYHMCFIVKPKGRTRRTEVLAALNLLGVVVALIAGQIDGITTGCILAFSALLLVVLWLLLPGTSEKSTSRSA